MTLPEFMALKRIWAGEQATRYNLSVNTEGVAFVPDDFMDTLGGGFGMSRVERVEAFMAKQQFDAMRVEVENAKLFQMKANPNSMDLDKVPEAFKKLAARSKRKRG